MSEHYYTSAPTSKSRIRQLEYEYRGEKVLFETDNGVFSKDEVDAGSEVLIRALPDDMTGSLLDIGCGWGAMGVTLGKKYPSLRLTLCDVNSRALELCRRNAALNRVQAEILLSDGCEHVEGQFDTVITNPPIRAGKQVIYRLFREAGQHLVGDGALYIVIRKQQGAESAVKYLKTIFADVSAVDKSGGYWVLKCTGFCGEAQSDPADHA